jgi:hypothetical protein
VATTTVTTRKRTTKRRKTAAKRTPVQRATGPGGTGQKAATWLALTMAKYAQKHSETVMSRKDAAILRITHEGCPTCKGNGQIFTKGKDGAFTGSKPCPAKPTRQTAGRMRVAIAARFGTDKNSGLVGWTCPCGKKEKPRFRDAKEATKALRTHERQKHGGKSVGGAWYGQVANADQLAPTPTATPVTKQVINSGMSDAEWEKQNKSMAPAAAARKGLCWQCAGNGALYSAFGGEQITVVCDQCTGTGKAKAAP